MCLNFWDFSKMFSIEASVAHHTRQGPGVLKDPKSAFVWFFEGSYEG